MFLFFYSPRLRFKQMIFKLLISRILNLTALLSVIQHLQNSHIFLGCDFQYSALKRNKNFEDITPLALNLNNFTSLHLE